MTEFGPSDPRYVALYPGGGFYAVGSMSIEPWSPELTCLTNPGDFTPGDYAVQSGFLYRFDAMVFATWQITVTPTHTGSAAGALLLDGFLYNCLPSSTYGPFLGLLHQTGGLGSSTRPEIYTRFRSAGGPQCTFFTRDLISAAPSELTVQASGTTYTLSGSVWYLTEDVI